VLRFLLRRFNKRRLEVRKGCKMFQVYPSARYLKVAGRGLLLLTGLLYLLAILLLLPTGASLLDGLVFIIISLPFLLLGILFNRAGSGRYVLTDEALLWQVANRERRLAYQDLHAYSLVGTLPRADLLLSTDRARIRISHQVEGFFELYRELRRRSTALQDAPSSNVPWELSVQPDHVRRGNTGQLATILLTGLIALLVTYLSQDLNLLRAYLRPGATPATLAFGMLQVTVLIAALVVGVSLADLLSLNSLTFLVGEIRAQHALGRERRWSGQDVIEISRQRHEQLFRGGTRVDFPLYILFANGEKLEITDSWAAAHDADLDQLQNSLRLLYLPPQPGAERPPDVRSTADDLIQQGDQHFRLGSFSEALNAYQQAIQLFPAYRFYNQQAGELLQQLGRYEDAAAAYQDLLEFAPGSDRGWKGLGECWLQMGRYEQAAQAFERSIEINSEDGGVFYSAAQAYRRLNNQARARDCLQRALRLRPELKADIQGDTAMQELL
jgi:tetratricopeptide (TPR) repeat protein